MISTIPILCTLIKRGDKPEYIKILLEYGSDPNIQDEDGRTPLHYAVKFGMEIKEVNIGKCDIMKILLDHKANPNIQDKNGMTPLHFCFMDKKTNTDEAKLLLEYNANPHITNKNDQSCLYYAIKNCKNNNDLELIELLLKKKVDIYNGLNSNYSPLWALLDNYLENANIKRNILDLLINSDVNFDIKFYVQNKEIIIGYTYVGDQINKYVSYETTPIIWALEHEIFDIAEILIKKNVNLKIKGGLLNASPLEIACIKDCPELINLIVSKLECENINEDKKN